MANLTKEEHAYYNRMNGMKKAQKRIDARRAEL